LGEIRSDYMFVNQLVVCTYIEMVKAHMQRENIVIITSVFMYIDCEQCMYCRSASDLTLMITSQSENKANGI
jgi:hypothetical protein